MEVSSKQKIAISEDLEISVKLIIVGFRELQSLDRINTLYYIPFYFLAGGLERFLKITLCFFYFKQNSTFPKQNFFSSGKKGHNLNILIDQIREHCFTKEYLKKPVAKVDYDFLKNDVLLLKIINLLTDFGEDSRYYNLNIVLGRSNNTDDPETEWEKLKIAIFKEIPNWDIEITDNNKMNEHSAFIYRKILITMEKFARSISRLYSLSDFGFEASRNFSYVQHFTFLKDEELGKLNYSTINQFKKV